MFVSDYLGHGAENAISAATLAAVTHTTPRELRRLIMDERKRGALILYQPGGRGSGSCRHWTKNRRGAKYPSFTTRRRRDAATVLQRLHPPGDF